jgi:hypothetical protein
VAPAPAIAAALRPGREDGLGAAAVDGELGEGLVGLEALERVEEPDDEAAVLALVAAEDADLEEAGLLEDTLEPAHLALDTVEVDVGPVERDGDLIA